MQQDGSNGWKTVELFRRDDTPVADHDGVSFETVRCSRMRDVLVQPSSSYNMDRSVSRGSTKTVPKPPSYPIAPTCCVTLTRLVTSARSFVDGERDREMRDP
ncbi:hypothetical protein ZHAS_00014722 [Anopheles sinensis]|uniref:Uncharacterized protein n=1 Tax=Anopheles sinensis TaxID=74873 RepID=A0A084W8Y6_ANOSI|nr:hypothetical protein ZHAS_00014722 [Anopheles sinensis]